MNKMLYQIQIPTWVLSSHLSRCYQPLNLTTNRYHHDELPDTYIAVKKRAADNTWVVMSRSALIEMANEIQIELEISEDLNRRQRAQYANTRDRLVDMLLEESQ